MYEQSTSEPAFGAVPDCDDDWDGLPADPPPDDFDADAEFARWVADIESGREPIPPLRETEPIPPLRETEVPAASIARGRPADEDPWPRTAATEPPGQAGEAFEQDGAADAMPPGPGLAALAEQAREELDALTDDQVLGLVSSTRRLRSRAEYLELTAVAEFARRRQAQLDAATAAGARPGRRAGEFADSELAIELITTRNTASDRMDMATDLRTRLPCAFAQLGAGRIDTDRAHAIWTYTKWLSAEDAARADEILAEAAPDLRYDQLARKAAALEMKLDPEAARQRKEIAHREGRRVEVRREDSGNASLSGRELDLADVLAAKANVDALAARLRNLGAAGSLRELRAAVYMSLLQSRDPLAGPAPDASPAAPVSAGADAPADASDPPPPDAGRQPAPARGDAAASAEDGGYTYDGVAGGGRWCPAGPARSAGSATADDEGPHYLYLGDDTGDDTGGPGQPVPPAAGRPSAPLPALINLTVPIGSLLGWSTAPAQAGGFGLLDPEQTRAIIKASSRHPRTRWSVTLVDASGQATAHGRARGQHPWNPHPSEPAPPGTSPPGTSPPGTSPPGTVPDATREAGLRDLIRALGIIFDPVARDTCDHRQAEDRYTPSRTLRDLVRARTSTCDAPGCNAQALYCDIDHTVPHPEGQTDQCNLGPKCRRHHRCKHAPGWRVEQPEPGIIRWILPSGRTRTTYPTRYDS